MWSAMEGLVDATASNTQLLATVVAATAVPLVGYLIVKKLRNRSRLPYPPGPKPVFFLGNALEFPDPKVGCMEDKLLEWTKEYGLVYTYYLPIVGRCIMIADPEMIRKVAISKNFNKSPMYKLFSPVIGTKSMVSTNGKEWAKQRKAFNPGFAPNFLRNMVDVMVEKLHRFVGCIEEDIAKGEATNSLVRSQTFTADIIVAVAFAEDWGGSEPRPARIWLEELTRLTTERVFSPMKFLFGFQLSRDIKRYEKLLDQEFRQVLERRLAAGASSESRDICSIAIDQTKKERDDGVDQEGDLTEEETSAIIDQLKTFFFAGHDTTASLISWALWLLSHNESILGKVRVELQEHGIWKNGLEASSPTYEDLQKLTYLEAVLKETLRMYTPVTGVSRYTDDLTESYNGYCVGEAILIVFPAIMHRTPLLWKEPDVFRPERFLDGSEENISGKFTPFSRGPRDCIGQYFAMLEAKLAISALVTKFNMECMDVNESMKVEVTCVPRDGAKIKFSPRN